MSEQVPALSALGARLADRLADARPPGVAAAYVFGAHAEGRMHRESDLDVGALFDRTAYPTRAARFDAGVRLGAWIAAELGEPRVDLVVLDDAPPGLAARVATSGTRVYCADAEADHALRRDAQLRAADLAPFLARARRLKLEAIRRPVPMSGT